MSLLEGRRARFTRIDREYDDATKTCKEVGRATFDGVITDVLVVNTFVHVLMLYDSGSLRLHSISDVTVISEPKEPFR